MRKATRTIVRPVLAGVALGLLGVGVGAVLENRSDPRPAVEEPGDDTPLVVAKRPQLVDADVLETAPDAIKSIIENAELCIQELNTQRADEPDLEERIASECLSPAREAIEAASTTP